MIVVTLEFPYSLKRENCTSKEFKRVNITPKEDNEARVSSVTPPPE